MPPPQPFLVTQRPPAVRMSPRSKSQKSHTKALSKAREAMKRKKQLDSSSSTNKTESVSTSGSLKKQRGQMREQAIVVDVTFDGDGVDSSTLASHSPSPGPAQSIYAPNGQSMTYHVSPCTLQVFQPAPMAVPVPVAPPPAPCLPSVDLMDQSGLMTLVKAYQVELEYWRRQHPESVAKVMTLEVENRRLRTELEVEKTKCANMMNGFRGLDLMVKSAAKEYNVLVGQSK